MWPPECCNVAMDLHRANVEAGEEEDDPEFNPCEGCPQQEWIVAHPCPPDCRDAWGTFHLTVGTTAARDLGAAAVVWEILRKRRGDEGVLRLVEEVGLIESERIAASNISQQERIERAREEAEAGRQARAALGEVV